MTSQADWMEKARALLAKLKPWMRPLPYYGNEEQMVRGLIDEIDALLSRPLPTSERAQIVAWLRVGAYEKTEVLTEREILLGVAAAIERGEHLPEPPAPRGEP